MSAPPEYVSSARQDYGPPTTSNVFDSLLDHKVTDATMSLQSVRTPVVRTTPTSSPEGDPEPDSTDINPEAVTQPPEDIIEKEVEYHIVEKKCDTDMPVDSLSGIVRIEDATIDNAGRITYPIVQDTESAEDSYVENPTTLIQAPMSTAIVQNVTKLPQNFTINMDGSVGNITTMNLSQDGTSTQTLWLPTILATGGPASDAKPEDDRQAGLSQIIITSESYVNDASMGRRNIVTETNYINRPKSSKVQILSNIPISRNSSFSQPYITHTKEITTPIFGTQNHVYKLSTNVVTQKHINNSVLCTKPTKNQSLVGSTMTSTVINSNPAKSVAYSHTFTKTTNLNKTLNKVNNGANLNAMVAASSGNTQCHVLSRVISGPNKMSVHSGRKSVNAFKKNQGSQKNQSRSVKIIQQTGSVHKSEGKTWPVANVATYKSQSIYGVIDSNTSKIIQKVGSPPHKSQAPLSLSKYPAKGDRLVLQSPCGPVLISTGPISTSLHKGPHYVQSGSTPNLRYVQTYGSTDQMTSVTQVSANQQLTAQILQSLSQPKLMFQTSHPINHILAPPPPIIEEIGVKTQNQKRIVFGDKSTLLTADDVIGMEERPNLTEELRRYSYQSLAFVMLDHTYALPVQKLPSPVPTTSSMTLTGPPPIMSPSQITTPMSPIIRTSPVIVSTATYDLPVVIPTSFQDNIPPPIPVAAMSMSIGSLGALSFKPQPPPPQEDDAASVISSLDGDRRPPARGGSDTETAPEGEEEGKTRCICDFTHDDGYMICCDRCGEWQHVDCMGIDRNNIPDVYMCELCQPRPVDRRHARAIQLRKREELHALGGSDSDSSTSGRLPGQRRKRLLTVTTYTNTSGSCVTTYNPAPPVLPPLPQPTLTLPKRGPKRPKKTDVVRKVTKKKLGDKRVKRKKEMIMNRSKYTSSLSNQSHWQESYELAVTNHYSPELRAKIMKYANRLGNSPSLAAVTAHMCTTVPHAGGKILIATKDLKENTPVIELRGKYMLSNQHRPQLQNSARAGSQKPGPFVFFYRLPKDNTQICIDTRTYGNEARFVRRSCKPNAELQHCIVKGTLHVYLVTTSLIPSNTEITVGHDSNGVKQPCACGNPKHCKVNGLNTSAMGRKSVDYPPRDKRARNRLSSSSSPVSPPPAPITPIKEPLTPVFPVKSEKKSPIKLEFAPTSPLKSVAIALNFDQPMKAEITEIKPEPEMDLTAKEEIKDIDEPDFVKMDIKVEETKVQEMPQPIPEVIENKPEVIENKPEVIENKPGVIENKPDVIENKPEVKGNKPEVKENKPEFREMPLEEKVEPHHVLVAKVEEPKNDVKDKEDSEDDKPLQPTIEDDKPLQPKIEEKKPKEEDKMEEEKPKIETKEAAKACNDRSSRSSKTHNQDSLDDKTDDSQDKLPTPGTKEKDKKKMTREERKMEAIMKAFERMEKQQQRKQEVKERQKRRESDPQLHGLEKDDYEEHCTSKKRKNSVSRRKGRARTTSQSNRRRLDSADSQMMTSEDEAPPPHRTPPRAPPRRNSTLPPAMGPCEDRRRSNDEVREEIGLSPACLLVEAAVGSVESAFKLPKTKKTMANEWIGRSPERTPSPYRSPYRPAIVNAPSLESLVRVASTIIGDLSGQGMEHEEENAQASPPRTVGRDRNRPPKKSKRVTRSTPEVLPEVVPSIMQHSAKKRWLRQAISEESDSPSAESPPNEMVTPLKKRRLARESISFEQITSVPVNQCHDETSPVLTSEDSPVKDENNSLRQYKVRNIMDSLYDRDRTRSDSGQGSDDQCNIDHDVLNVNIKGPHDSENIRRIIGVPTPEEELPPEIPKPEDMTTNNNNVVNENIFNKIVPMEIDTTMPQSKIDLNENSNSEAKGIDSPNDKLNSSQSADTSGSSSPRNDMDDIQKKIHSFHTENILMLKSRNRKPPKEKRKKVNLNFDLNMVDDQISVQLLMDENSKSSLNGDIHDEENDESKLHVATENIPLPPVESIPLPAPENIPLPLEPSPMPVMPPPEAIPLPEEPMKPSKRPSTPPEKPDKDRPSVLDSAGTIPFASRFSSTGLFSGIFTNMPQFNMESRINENVPNMSIIKSAIDRTTSLEGGLFEKDSITTPADELKEVQDILHRVNNMDSNNSVLLSGVLGSTPAVMSPKPAAKPFCARSSDPRLNPSAAEKPKPIRRKLSITEYRKRLKGPATSDETSQPSEAPEAPEWSSGSSGAGSLSPQRLEAAAAAAVDDLEQRLHRDLNTHHLPKGVFDAQPTASERQREDLSSRLRREFGLALPEDESARPPIEPAENAGPPTTKRCDR